MDLHCISCSAAPAPHCCAHIRCHRDLGLAGPVSLFLCTPGGPWGGTEEGRDLKGSPRSGQKGGRRRLSKQSVTTAVEAGSCRQGDSGWAQAGRPGGESTCQGPPDRAEQILVVSARFCLSKPAGVIATTATGGLQHGCHTTGRWAERRLMPYGSSMS